MVFSSTLFLFVFLPLVLLLYYLVKPQFQMVNSLIYNIRHEDADAAPKKILVIGDSFNWSLSSYLAVGVQQVDVLHNASFDGSIRTYIQKNKPDYVVVCYNDAEFYVEYTEKAYDFR